MRQLCEPWRCVRWKWCKCTKEDGWFDLLEETMGGTEQILSIWGNGAGYIGVERRAEDEAFAYYIGMHGPLRIACVLAIRHRMLREM